MPILFRSACLMAVLVVLALTGFSPQAYAGDYRVHTCKLPDGSPAATDGWGPQTDILGFHLANTCSAGETMRTEMAGLGMGVGSQRVWRWAAPANTSLQAMELYRSFSLAPGDANGTPTMSIDAGSSRLERNGSSMATGNGIDARGTISTPFAPSNRISVASPSSLAANEITLLLGCFGPSGQSCPGTGAARSELHVHAATFTLRDTLAPSITNVGGSLTTAGDKKGVEALQFDATDAGAGIYRTFLDVDGATVATSTPDLNGGRCADVVPANADPYEYEYRTPCPLALSAVRIPLDTRTLSEGTHTVALRVEDAAGNATAAYGPTAFAVRNAAQGGDVTPTPTPTTPTTGGSAGAGGNAASGGTTTATAGAATVNGAGGGPGARVSVVILSSNQRSVRLSYGRSVTLSGRVTTPSGDPVAGATVDVLSQTRLRGAKLSRIATVRTDRAGAFRYTVPAGPSRLIRFGYRARLGDAAYAHTTDIDVRVAGKVTLRLSRTTLRNGQTLTYKGTVAGVGARRPLVQIQVRSQGRWVNVCVVRTRGKGSYSCRYHFRRTFRPTTYTFRALVRKQEGLPYETDTSPRQSVRVRP
jgi:hypothetical protein